LIVECRFVEPAIHGIVGFASSAVSRSKAPTLLDNLASQGLIPKKIVSFKLAHVCIYSCSAFFLIHLSLCALTARQP
jgi:hypothetical protein